MFWSLLWRMLWKYFAYFKYESIFPHPECETISLRSSTWELRRIPGGAIHRNLGHGPKNFSFSNYSTLGVQQFVKMSICVSSIIYYKLIDIDCYSIHCVCLSFPCPVNSVSTDLNDESNKSHWYDFIQLLSYNGKMTTFKCFTCWS